MNIKRLVIENFKSIEKIELENPNPFTVFVGPNGAGKSNIFEALEFMNLATKASGLLESMFGGTDKFVNRRASKKTVNALAVLDSVSLELKLKGDENQVSAYRVIGPEITDGNTEKAIGKRQDIDQFLANFSRLFVGNHGLVKFTYKDDDRLSLSADNLKLVLKRVLSNAPLRQEIFEWLELFVPGFKAVEIDDRDEIRWLEESSDRYFTEDLISDGTKSILALLTAVYQSDKPQFLCIEEPENGLNPKVTKELVQLFRFACEEYGHYIWLNTHSQSLVSVLTPEEIILVDKVDGATKTKQVAGMNLHGLPMDEAWLSNALGGGIPW
ncbi:AAA family ATPase [Fibrivirga algicola]|uniref:AAA family ATPase n=1 Tax=Fibrivirga algicola TaxID=2950420 RepID=A0ABX0QBQ3_9BACT|nr:AAA family ATPase [Fibrivirga algicola]NID08616.1 AAA family ATPase [Fibrivirga algicola]